MAADFLWLLQFLKFYFWINYKIYMELKIIMFRQDTHEEQILEDRL